MIVRSDQETHPENRLKCSCHEWYDITEMGNWTQGSGGGRMHARPVSELSADPTIWERSATDHESLRTAIERAGGIACEHAFSATTYLDGEVGLNDGVHRWAVADELGLSRAPVDMTYEQEETADPWAGWTLG